MSPFRDFAATTGMGAGPVPVFDGAPPDFVGVILGHRKYAPKLSGRRTDSDSHRRRRGEALVFLGRALSVGGGVTGADEPDCSIGIRGLSGIFFLARRAAMAYFCLRVCRSGFSRQVRVVGDLSRLEPRFHSLLSSLSLQHQPHRGRSRPEGRRLPSMFEAEPIST